MLCVLTLTSCTQPVEDPSSEPIAAYDPLPWVDPFVATGGAGAEIANVNPGASLPFGMTLVGPDTRSSAGQVSFYHCAGYYWEDTHIDGFSHTHAHGVGVVDYGTIAVMPRASWDPAFTSQSQRAAPFRHDEEWASPGFYQVVLQDDGTEVEIVATERGAIHRYTFLNPENPILILDLGHHIADTEVIEGQLEVDLETGVVQGFQRLYGSYSRRFDGIQTFFDAQVSPLPTGGGTWSDPENPNSDVWVSESPTAGTWLVFPTGTKTVELRMGLSYTDNDGARLNRTTELPPELDFSTLHQRAENAWRLQLQRVAVRGDEALKRRLHTAHYHASLMPSVVSDVDGRYRSMQDDLRTADFPYYSDFSLWDTFRTQHPWLIWMHPERQTDMNRSLLQMYSDGGSLPRWPLAHGYTGGMVGSPAQQVLAESHLKGVTGWETDTSFETVVQASLAPQEYASRAGLTAYLDKGYVTWEAASTPAALTLEYAWSDHAMAQWATSLGREDDASTMGALAQNWRNTWDPSAGFFLGRYADGSFETHTGYTRWSDDFVEGNAWHYLWMVPYDVQGMADLQHDGDLFAWQDKTRDFWAQVFLEEDDVLPDDYYWHGNEPDIHYAFLGSLGGAPELTATASRWVMENRYGLDERGLDGNDDAGTLSAWYLFAALGMYPVAGTDQYAVGSPVFERVELSREGQPDLVLRAPGTNPETLYVHQILFDGEPSPTPHFRHAELAQANEILFIMGQDPMPWTP
jgi:predicted alpha-1,2-mannosidase